MRIIHYNAKEGTMKIEPENLEDLWHLEKIINPRDVITGTTERRYKAPGREKESGEKKKVRIELEVEKAELHKHANILRVTGRILSGMPEEYVQVGQYHTIDIEPNFQYVIRKEKWNKYELDRMAEAKKSSKRPIIRIVVMDNSTANIATLRGYGLEYDCEIRSRTSKRDEQYDEKMKKYFGEILSVIKDSKRTIIAGPGFIPEEFKEYVKEKVPKIMSSLSFAHSSTAEKSGVYELMKSGVVSNVLKEDRISKEFENIESFLAELHKGSGFAVYGKTEVMEAIQMGALKKLLILDEFVRKNPSFLDDAK
ncbi:MAG: mRNA surveillance protein pelota, partial [Candidatus Micrarchaeia archaeon]